MRNSTTNKRILIKDEKRLARIRKKIDEENKNLEVDIAHDWTLY